MTDATSESWDEWAARTVRKPGFIDDRCDVCEHASESHCAGVGKCFACQAICRCARFVARTPPRPTIVRPPDPPTSPSSPSPA